MKILWYNEKGNKIHRRNVENEKMQTNHQNILKDMGTRNKMSERLQRNEIESKRTYKRKRERGRKEKKLPGQNINKTK